MNELSLKQLVNEGKATLFYIHGTARSGSTIAEVVFSKLADHAIHQPFAGLRHQLGGPLRANKLPFDEDIYEAGCGLIVEAIQKTLQKQNHVTILVKEVSRFFYPEIWLKWIQIPEKFLFFVREPHLQYLSWLSYVTDLVFKKNGSLMNNPALVLEKAKEIETVTLQNLRPAWSGTTMSYNFQEWQALLHDWQVLRAAIKGSSKKLAVLDLIELRQNPQYAISKTLEQLDFAVDNLEEFDCDLLAHSKEKILDIRNTDRAQVRKARNSNEINRLVPGEAVSPYAFPSQSQTHILQLIPLYLELLYAPENVAMPSWQQLDTPVTGNDTLRLANLHPFVAYAIARFHQHSTSSLESAPLIDQIVNGKTKTVLGEEKLNLALFEESFAMVDDYWQQMNSF